MARKTPSRMELRKQLEAADSKKATTGGDGTTKKKAAKKKKATSRTKVKAAQRKVLIWGVYSASMKEEARFPYDQREQAEKKLKQLRSKGKKPYFIQAIKEPIVEAPPSQDE